jgi:hypothetical protein
MTFGPVAFFLRRTARLLVLDLHDDTRHPQPLLVLDAPGDRSGRELLRWRRHGVSNRERQHRNADMKRSAIPPSAPSSDVSTPRT